jgi:Protein of unknown function (DUF2793)
MQETDNLRLPYLIAAQAQKHVTHNEALRGLDAIIQLAVADRDLATPPASPGDGERYLVAASATGEWTGHDGRIAAYQDGAWLFYEPREGWIVWIADENVALAFDGSSWLSLSGASVSVNPTSLVGVNATADTTNRLSVSSPAVLLNHEGAGHQLKINKAAASDTGSLLFQTAFSGRAEMGLAGDDDFRFKVSSDGSTWNEAIVVDRTSGEVTFPNTTVSGGTAPNLVINGDFQINQRVFAGGALTAGSYGFDRWKAATGGANISVTGYTVTLTSGELEQVVETALWGHDSFASLDVTVSVEDPSAGLTVTFGSQSGTVPAGSGRQAVTLTLGAGDTGNLSLKLTKATAGSVTFGRVKLELGSSTTGWQARDLGAEVSLCRRYYEKTYNLDVAPGTATEDGIHVHFLANTAAARGFVPWLATKRALPTLVYYDDLGNLNKVRVDPNSNQTFTTGGASTSKRGFTLDAQATSSGWKLFIHYTADAEF